MGKIQRIELYHVSIPYRETFYPSWIPGYPQTHNRFTLARVYTDDGLEGIAAGNAFTTERSGLGDLIGGFLLGLDSGDMPGIRQHLREASYLGWRNWWLEAAFWDLRGKALGKPVYKLLQETEKTVTKLNLYASSGEVRPFGKRKWYLDVIREKGFKAVKIRVKDPERKDDMTILKQVRRELGDGFKVAVDANQGWPVSIIDRTPVWDLEYATNFGKACDDIGIAWIEEPLDMHDWEGMAELRRRINTPVSGAELLGDWHEIKAVFEHECLDKYQPDATFCGGLTVSKRVMDECRRRGLHFSPHTWTNGIGLVVNMHALAAWEHHESELLEFPYEPPSIVPEEREGVIAPVTANPDGTVDVPQAPGLGISILEDRLKKYGRRFHVSTPLRLAVKTIREKGLKTALELKKKKK